MSRSPLSFFKELWHAWNIRGCILLSLLLQVLLPLLAPLRKQYGKKPLLVFMWLAFLLWDWLDTVTIGLISRNIGDASKKNDGNEEFMALWASFLMLHLGGPDAITSFSIEDNQLWRRHLTGLIFQFLSTAYVIYLSFPQSRIWIPTAMVFLAGTFKYAERVRALYLASLDRVGHLEGQNEYHGLDYQDAVEAHRSVSSVDVSESARIMPRVVEYAEDSENTGEEKDRESLKNLLQEASRFFDTFKGFIVGTIFSSTHREWSRQYFLNGNSTQAFRLIEYELSFMYDLLHTKFVVLRSPGWLFVRVISFLSLLGALVVFLIIEVQHEFRNKLDVKLSYVLLASAIGLEILNFVMLVFSDETVIAKKGIWKEVISRLIIFPPELNLKITLYPGFILRRHRWSWSCTQYDMISYCFNSPPRWLSKLAAFVYLREILDAMYVGWFSYSRLVEKYLEEFIFVQLKQKSDMAESLQYVKEACSQRGGSALRQANHDSKLKWSIEEYQYEESLLLWHVATEICYQTHDPQEQNDTHPGSHKEICKRLSDYMFYLFVMEAKLMAPVSGGWEKTFNDTCAEARRFFKRAGLQKSDLKKACQRIIDEDTPVRPDAVKGSNCKSVLFDASILTKQLLKLGNDQWKVMSLVWMELMSYAAINCSPIQHAQQPSRGGQLLTFVWLLMNHLGLGSQFSEYNLQTRTTMVSLE